jgi:hypothetical protein
LGSCLRAGLDHTKGHTMSTLTRFHIHGLSRYRI